MRNLLLSPIKSTICIHKMVIILVLPLLYRVCASDVIDEYLDQEIRKLNLIIFGLPESLCAPVDEHISGDSDSFRKLVSSDFKIEDICIEKVTRLGKLVREKPRPLLVTLVDSSVRRNILRNVKILNNSSSYKKVFINSDLTPEERIASKQLLKNFIIANNR